ncbi:MAG: hypothetical protein A2020_06375 [Lentisphaerae bacterium GWF2_45_14]|nr:MAG: hypothetical protein A2020_06375 [Lentisphaerae bacterium GWF2_45_14]
MAGEKKSFSPCEIPAKPGVYIYRDSFGSVIYVGKAVNLRKRMSQYFRPSSARMADPKLRSLIKSIDSWEFHVVKNEDESLLLESSLIKKYMPRYNVLLRDDKRFLMIKINLNEKFPKLYLARIRKDDGMKYFGPFPKGSILRETVAFLTRRFGLRSCKSVIPSENDKKHCLARIIKDCSCPCSGVISPEDYRSRVESMLDILNGNVKDILSEIKEEMLKSSSLKKFEAAAKWRDIASGIEEVFGPRNRSFRYASIKSESGSEAVNDLQNVLKLSSPPDPIEGFDISNIGGELAVGGMVSFKNGRPDKKNYRRFRIKSVHQIDDFAMIKEVIRRRFSRLIDEKLPLPGLVMIDGGKGQLNAALEALCELKSSPIPVIGLAKKNEEIFVPGIPEPIVLDRHRPALKLLQSVRDEVHRFSIQYHRELRLKRIQESLLDEIPGIGPERKRALLVEFGSVSEIRKTSPEELASRVSGISLSLALKILSYVNKISKK